ncbi:hypothetical protein [Paenarthrobacter sp. PH39-S1]|uniref:hypothetical protein n=1 Tax=Paenarthrobacter sp. PH39-S1 TaxID=3046204 RepID=UPI0024BACC58|nr:hypothetical protein [Paenarthrobacter sp. PH39-S1]MDJ0356253.1 hypothetical protein [Paenarthrobacter sp. PH39-S1]
MVASIRRPRRGKTASPALALGKQAQALVASADPPGDRLKRNEIFLIDAIDLKPSPGSVLDNADDRCTRRYRFPVYIQHTSTVSRAGKSIVKTGLKESVVVLVDGSPIEEDREFKIAHVWRPALTMHLSEHLGVVSLQQPPRGRLQPLGPS